MRRPPQLLPHVLSKPNRVSYGLLSREQCAKDTPTTRKLLAVPFLGKDVPSPASEFAHPDVVIGFTILAYRYEGMRKSDFAKVIADQLDVLEMQSGPVEARPAYTLYKKWVQLAGGRVRGTRLDAGAAPPAAEFAEIWPLHLLDVADTSSSTCCCGCSRGCRSWWSTISPTSSSPRRCSTRRSSSPPPRRNSAAI